MENSVVVTFYFTSGLSQEYIMGKEQFNKILQGLRQSFDASILTEYYGINFSHVTHYLVKEKD